MALILEVEQPDGRRTRHVLGDRPLTIGRGLTNDVVLDDPYVDATHVRVSVAEQRDEERAEPWPGGEDVRSSRIAVDDLGSVNGIVVRDARERGRVMLGAGERVRIGRTTLHVRDSEAVLAPALVDDVREPPTIVPVSSAASTGSVWQWLESTRSRIAVLAAVLAVAVLRTWSTDYSRAPANEILTTVLGMAALASMWAGLWAIASRIVVHRFRFLGHLVLVCAFGATIVVVNWLTDWMWFFFPALPSQGAVVGLITLILLTVLIAAHLRFASSMTARRRWRAAAIVTGGALVLLLLQTLTRDDASYRVPSYPQVLEPADAAIVPSESIESLDAMLSSLRSDVDKLAAP